MKKRSAHFSTEQLQAILSPAPSRSPHSLRALFSYCFTSIAPSSLWAIFSRPSRSLRTLEQFARAWSEAESDPEIAHSDEGAMGMDRRANQSSERMRRATGRLAKWWLGYEWINAVVMLFLLFSFTFNLHASTDLEPLVIESGSAEYNGHEILLSGDVDVKHALGKITSKNLSVFSSEDCEKKGDLSQLQVNDNVTIHLQGGGKLECQKAHVDSIGLRGLFYGDREHPEVIYSQGSPETPALLIKSSQMQLNLARQQGSKSLFVRQIEANHHVKGAMSVPSQQKTEFNTDALIWDEKAQTLTLKGHVRVNQEGKLTIKTDNKVSISQILKEGKKEIGIIQSPKETEIVYYDEKNGPSHKITCHGPLTIDHEHMQTWMSSPKNDLGNIIQDKQVYFEDPSGDLYADEIVLKYTKNGQQLQLSKVVLEGNVKMLNRFDGHLKESSSVLHYALADKVEYTPSRGEILLTSQEGHRVLFFDKVNKVQMSAPTLKVIRPGPNRKESIQGLGDVRFTFIDGELNQLKSHFPLEDSQ
jgi:lipopolysaccharide export system protein LptA